jgi:hypothetical protein
MTIHGAFNYKELDETQASVWGRFTKLLIIINSLKLCAKC